MCKCTPGIKTPFCGKPGCERPTVEVTIKPALTVERIREELADMVGLKLNPDTNAEIVRRLNAMGLFDFSVKAEPACTDERPCVNWEQYDRLLAHANNIVYDKTKNTLADWISDYGGRENEKGYVEFGSHYALAKMLDRRDKEVIRNVLEALVGELPAQTAAQEPTLTDAAKDVLAERRRQVEAEGRTPEHDDKYPGGQLACAAIAYLMVGVNPNGARLWWPWDVKTFKPSPDTRRNLIKAGALLLADIEWLDRLRAKLVEPAKQEPLAGRVCSKVSAVAAESDDLTQFLEQTDFDAAEKVASDTVANQRELPAGEDDCEGCKI